MPGQDVHGGRRRRPGFWRGQEASVEVEYLLILAFVIFPLCIVMPGAIISTCQGVFERLDLWVNLPFP